MKTSFKYYLLTLLAFTFIFNSCKKDKEDKLNELRPNFSGALVNPDINIPEFQMPSGGGSIPSKYDLSPNMPPIRDQGRQGSCVAFAVSSMKSYQEKMQYSYSYNDNSKIMSPAYIYNQIKLNDNCEKAGSYADSALALLKVQGVATEQAFPYDQWNCSKLPNSTIKQGAKQNKIKSYEPIFYSNPISALDKMRYVISNNQPIIYSFKVDKEFAEMSNSFSWGDNTWKSNNSGDPFDENGNRVTAYHCVLLVGYDNAKNAFKLRNSWGEQWQEDGYCWVDYSWLIQRGQYYALVAWDENIVGGSEITISGTSPSQVQVGQSQNFTMTIQNTGTAVLNVNDINITGNSSGIFSFPSGKPALPFILAPNASKQVILKFAPAAAQTYNATFDVLSDAVSGSGSSQLTGTGVSSSQTKVIRLTKTTCSDVQTGQNTQFILTVHNDGNTSFEVNSISSSNGVFTVSGFSPQVVGAGSSVDYTVLFSPSNVQLYSTVLSVNSTATSGTNTISVSASGLSGGSGVTVTPGVGTYTDCNYGSATRTLSLNGWSTSSFTTNNYKIKVKSYDQNTGDIVFSVKRCNGQNIQELISVSIYDMNPNVTDGPTIESGFTGDPEVILTRNISFAGSDTKQFIAIIETMGSWTDPNYCTQVITISW